MSLIDNLIFSVNNIIPVFILLFLGYYLKFKNIINDTFVDISSKLVYNIALPIYLFSELSKTDFTSVFDSKLIIFIYSGVVLSFVGSWYMGKKMKLDNKDLGVFVQGAFRSNFAVIGLAIIANVLGKAGIPKGSLVLAFIVPLLNFLSVVVLEVTLNTDGKLKLLKIAGTILKSPLIIGVLCAAPFSIFRISLPGTINTTFDYLSALTLPLAIIGIGGSLNFSQLAKASKNAVQASIMKLIWIPLVMTYLAYLIGFRSIDLGIIFVYFASPTAIVSFIMAQAMGGNSKLAGNIIVITTLGAAFTMSLGVFLLRSFNLI